MIAGLIREGINGIAIQAHLEQPFGDMNLNVPRMPDWLCRPEEASIAARNVLGYMPLRKIDGIEAEE
jgi:hypothetical protein